MAVKEKSQTSRAQYMVVYLSPEEHRALSEMADLDVRTIGSEVVWLMNEELDRRREKGRKPSRT